jgi:hypothetical protein
MEAKQLGPTEAMSFFGQIVTPPAAALFDFSIQPSSAQPLKLVALQPQAEET